MSGYIGTQPVPQATQTRDAFTATASQTSFATGGYSPGFIDVFLNGVKLAAADYTATNGSEVVLAVGAALNDIIETVAYTTFETSKNATLAQGALADTALQPTGDGSGLTGISPHKPVAVTGTTPSLDLGTYNFFDSGALTGDTTLTFASVPTDAKWQYKFSPVTLVGAWDVSELSSLQSFSVGGQEGAAQGMFFKPDGTKMYITGYSGDDVNEYDLSTAWDISTANLLQSFSVAAQEDQPRAVFFKPDGTKMYIIGTTGKDVNEYDLSTAWDVSTAVYLQLFSVATEEVNPYGIFFKPDGTKMYITGATGADVNEYDLSTAWNVSTAVFLQLFSLAGQGLGPNGISFKPDGTKMYIIDANDDEVNEYDLSTAWDVTSAVFLQLFSVVAQNSVPTDIFFKPDGLKMYMLGDFNDIVYEYDLGSPTTLTLPAALQNTPRLALSHDADVLYEFVTDDAGVTVTLISEEIV
jgi:DNA-binding beta-propeller fold protein YncE|tara:strand:+ start:129 stop:1532 length:1404 start_codon:yes stop_codon:yes gene_type:complete